MQKQFRDMDKKIIYCDDYVLRSTVKDVTNEWKVSDLSMAKTENDRLYIFDNAGNCVVSSWLNKNDHLKIAKDIANHINAQGKPVPISQQGIETMKKDNEESNTAKGCAVFMAIGLAIALAIGAFIFISKPSPEQTYINQMNTIINATDRNIEDLAQLLKSPAVLDSDWHDQVSKYATETQSLLLAGIDTVAPPSGEEMHEYFVIYAEEMHDSLSYTVDGLANFDNDLMTKGNNAIYRAKAYKDVYTESYNKYNEKYAR